LQAIREREFQSASDQVVTYQIQFQGSDLPLYYIVSPEAERGIEIP
jgi:hypothetical protein